MAYMAIVKFHLMVHQRKFWTPLSYEYWFLEVAPGPPRAGSGLSKTSFSVPPVRADRQGDKYEN
jgi:hypothetical protein